MLTFQHGRSNNIRRRRVPKARLTAPNNPVDNGDARPFGPLSGIRPA